MSVKEDNVSLLKRVREMCLNGQVAGAELELHSVHRQAGCPPEARVVLAALLARRGRHKDARAILKDVQPDTIPQSDPCQVKLAVSVLIALDRPDEAEELSRAFHRAYGHEATRWLRDMSVPGSYRLRWSPDLAVDELAHDLAREPKAIAALVYAQRHQRDLPTIKLLRKAIRRIVPLFEHDGPQMASICRAIAELSVMAGDHHQARRWAHRGLEEDPYCATLALLIDRLPDDDSTALPARSVLTCVAQHHPQYPDVQAALIRRESAEGQVTAARDRLARWLKREPYSPHALQLQEDLAA
jgi:hypothetical protein